MTAAAASPEPLTAVSRADAPPPAGFVLRRNDWGAFRAAEPGTDDVLLLRPTSDGLRIERPGIFETIAWDDVVGVALTDVRVGALKIPVARILFQRGPSLDLADVLAPGAGDLPMTLEPAGPPLLRVERLRMVVAAVVAASGLAPRSRDHFHRGGRGVPVPELTARPRRLPPWAPPFLLAGSVGVLMLLVPSISLAAAIAIHVAIAIHEGGHALAMRLLGTEVRSILFLPGLGAATFAEHPFRTRWDDVRIALAGPSTGIPVAVVTLAVCTGPPPVAVQWGLVVAVLYNLMNLLPLLPMDGGRIVLSIAAGLPRVLRSVLAWSPLVLVGALALLGAEVVGIGVAVVLAISVLATRLTLRRLDFHQWVLDLPLDPAALRAALRDLTWGFHGIAREDVDGGTPATPMSPWQTIASGLLYLGIGTALLLSSIALIPLVRDVGEAFRE